MKAPVIIVGIGEVGSVFARGFLRNAYPVYPVTREVDMQQLATQIPEPALVLLAVAENAVHEQLQSIPTVWRDKVALLQNELLPGDWQRFGYRNPTVISVWFEKKKGQDTKVLISSPVFGPQASLLIAALAALGIPARHIETMAEMQQELVIKNVYILTTNLAGMECGGTVAKLWNEHRELARSVSLEVIALQEKLTGQPLDPEPLIAGMVKAFAGDWDHKCMGRSAPARLQRALSLGQQHGLALPILHGIAANCSE